MSETSQSRAVKNYRSRLVERGMARFEVLGRVTDRELIRSLARRLTEGRSGCPPPADSRQPRRCRKPTTQGWDPRSAAPLAAGRGRCHPFPSVRVRS